VVNTTGKGCASPLGLERALPSYFAGMGQSVC